MRPVFRCRKVKMLKALRSFSLRLWWFVLAYYIAAHYVVRELFLRKFGFSRGLQGKELQKHDGCLAMVTGGSRGIGLEIVHYLLSFGYSVIIGSSSDEQRRANLKNEIKKKYPQSSVEVWHLDLASLKSVKAFAEKFLSTGQKLHLLVNNAGIMFVPHEETEDGLERHFAVNYLSHFLLTSLLLPVLDASGTKERKARIINSTSCIHYVGSLHLEDLQGRLNYSKYYAYMQSKLAQVMFTYTLQSFLDKKGYNITVNCAHPGVVNTDLMNCVWWTSYVGSVFFKTATEGAQTVSYSALSPEMEGIGGKYLEECNIVESSSNSKDIALQNSLWIKSLDLIKPWLEEEQFSQLSTFSQEVSQNGATR